MEVFFTIVLIISAFLKSIFPKYFFFHTVDILNSLNLSLIKNHSLLCSFQALHDAFVFEILCSAM